jgi:hypothetical protein
MVEFRWIALIALWTLLIGPIVGVPNGSSSREVPAAQVKTKPPAQR